MAKNGKAEKIAAALKAKSNLVKNGEVVMTNEPQQGPITAEQEQALETFVEQHEASKAGSAEPVIADDDEDDDDEEPIPQGEPKAHFAAELVYDIERAELMAAVERGDLQPAGWKAVTIGKGKSGTGKAEFGLYEKLVALTDAGALFLSHGVEFGEPVPGKKRKPKGKLDFFDYGFDLEAKRPLRKALLKAIAGPGKEIDKAVELMLVHKLLNPATGLPHTKETLREMIVNSRAAAGMTV